MGEKLSERSIVFLVLFLISIIAWLATFNKIIHLYILFIMLYLGGGVVLSISRDRSKISLSLITKIFYIICILSLSTMLGIGILSMDFSLQETVPHPTYFIAMGVMFISAIITFIFRLRDKRESDGSDSFYDNEIRQIALITNSHGPTNSIFSPKAATSLSTTSSFGPIQPINTAIPHKITVLSFNGTDQSQSSTPIKKRTDWLCMVCGQVNKGIRTKCSECQTQSPRRLNL
ncbi:MAG: hypothetical protein ACTSRE_14705 [Promethearchaeota archaeon]